MNGKLVSGSIKTTNPISNQKPEPPVTPSVTGETRVPDWFSSLAAGVWRGDAVGIIANNLRIAQATVGVSGEVGSAQTDVGTARDTTLDALLFGLGDEALDFQIVQLEFTHDRYSSWKC